MAEDTRTDPPGHPVEAFLSTALDALKGLADATVWSMDAETTTRVVGLAARVAAGVAEVEARALGQAEVLGLPAVAGCRDLRRWVQQTTGAHLASWAGLASGNNESAGKRLSGTTTAGNRWLKTALVQAAWAASRSRKTSLARKFFRIAASRGKKRAAIAVAHALLVIVYHILKENTTYREAEAPGEAA